MIKYYPLKSAFSELDTKNFTEISLVYIMVQSAITLRH